MTHAGVVNIVCLAGLAILLGCAGVLLWTAGYLGQAQASNEPKTNYTRVLGIQQGTIVVKLRVELALDDASQQTGMMWRTRMDESEGMLFVFPDSDIRTFWMKDTLIPLDMVFIGAGGTIVDIHPNARPRDTTFITSAAPAVAVLEVKGGQMARWGIGVGGTVSDPLLVR